MLSRFASTTARRATLVRTTPSAILQPRFEFHASARREEEQKEVAAKPESSSWDPMYSVPLGIAFAVPAIKYEWYVVNEETQLAACMIAFTMIVYKQFGGVIKDALEADGKQIIEEHNKIEDEVIQILQSKIEDVEMQKDIVKDAEDIKAIKEATYEKLNEAGKIKPQYEFKAQVEKLLGIIQTEEATMLEKSKVALMEEATSAVQESFASDVGLKKSSLDVAIAMLKGGKAGQDPVKSAYLKFFQEKAAAASKVDASAEVAEARSNIITKLNAVAKSEGFYFEFDASGKPKMVA